MNAVDWVEQLGAIGRQVQQVERQLRQPVVALASLTRLGDLLVDPVDRLSALIAPHIQPAPRPEASLQRPVPERFDFLPVQPLDAEGSTKFSPDERDTGVSHHRSQAAIDLERDLNAQTLFEIAGTADPQPMPTPSQRGGVRLTRDRASLLSMLQTAIRPAGAQPASPGSEPQPVQWGGGDRPGDGVGGHQPAGVTAQARLQRGSAPPAGKPSLWQSPAGYANSGPVGVTGSASVRDVSGDFPTQLRNDALPSRAVTMGSTEGRASDERRYATSVALEQPISAGMRRTGAPLVDAITDDPGVELRWGVMPEARQDLQVWSEPTPAPAPLSALQIDQILDALDERLELLMLRAYGVTP